MNKEFWRAKGTEGDSAFGSPSRIGSKRSPQWFIDAAEPELFPNKKQAAQTLNSASNTGIANMNVPSWDNASSFQSVPNQFIDRLFGSETESSISFADRNLCPTGTGQAFNRENESSFISMGQAYDKGDNDVTLIGLTHNRGDSQIGSMSPTYVKGDDNVVPTSDTYSKEDANMISFGGFHDAHEIIPVGRSISSFDEMYYQSSIQTPEAVHEKELRGSNSNVAVSNNQVVKSKAESQSKTKPDSKNTRKEAPNSFPSNVRSLISTGMLDGVPVKYISVSREELRGTIKGSGYLCGCQSCNYSKVLNAYEFERHAGCKTKHPNNHIYFENGKTIYQIVQELRNTPESMLFDVIQTVFGAPINQKSFRIWKESFQAATRELQRIYGKEELNL